MEMDFSLPQNDYMDYKGRYYNKEEYEKALQECMDRNKECFKGIPVVAGDSGGSVVLTERLIGSAVVSKDCTKATVEVFDTPMGRVFKCMMENGIQPSLSLNANGTVNADGVVENLKIVSLKPTSNGKALL